MKKTKIKNLATLAMLTALSLVLGLMVKLPTPTGVTTLLDVGIFFTAFYLGKKEGAIVGGLSAFIFDLIAGYPQWMVISLFAHGLQGFLAGFSGKKRVVDLVLATASMVSIYFLASSLMNGVGAALLEVPTNIMQNVVGIIGGGTIYQLIKRKFLN